MGAITEFIKMMSHRIIIKSNIMSIPGSNFGMRSTQLSLNGGRNDSSNMMLGSRYMTFYYLKMQEIIDYEITELTNTIVGIFRDYLVTYFNDTDQLITLKDPSKKSQELKINEIFNQLKYADDCKKHLNDIIYQGGYCYKITWNAEKKKYDKEVLANPHTVVDVSEGNKLKSRLVISTTGKVLEVNPISIVRIGNTDLELINDLNPEVDSWRMEDNKITKDVEYLAATPLYYNISGRVKELLLKDQVITLLGIKDLIQPLLLLIRVDKNTPIDQANQLALNAENLINKYSDISSIMTRNFSISDLMDSLINNIRVLPDYSSSLGDMNTVDLSKLSEKIEQIRQEQDNLRESILNSVGIPLDLFAGRATRFEALKTSERLNSKINYLCKSIDSGVKRTAADFYYILTGEEIDPNEFESNMFTKTLVEYNAAINSADMVSSLIQSINGIFDSVANTAKTIEVLDVKEYYEYVRNQIKMVDPDIEKMISDEDIKRVWNTIMKERKMNQMQQTEDGMMMGMEGGGMPGY